jgi:pimeloyl-ACP methyl ester carboxylesterase
VNRRALSSCLVAGAILAVLASPSQAATQSLTCPRVDRVEAEIVGVAPSLLRRIIQRSQCTLVRVPLDRSGRIPGTIDLFTERVPSESASRGAVLALAGGPGQGASSVMLELAAALGPVLHDRDLIVLDQRGTGRSGVLECPTLEKERVGPLDPAVRACAAALGSRRALYTTLDSADDIEVVRRELGSERLSLYGTSYGTKVALAYAEQYPDRVERILLDSVVPLDGPDPFSRDVFRAIPRVLRTLCAAGACRTATPDPVGDLAALVKRLAAAPLRGYVVGADGKRRPRRIGRLRLLRILIDGDFDPGLRADFPASVRAAERGDGAPLLRLALRASPAGGITVPRTVFSPALFVATACEEGPLPWELVDQFSNRWGRAIARAGALPDSDFFPFDRATGRASDTLRLCAHWPADGPARKLEVGPLPNVPALLLSGEDDLRTPSEGAGRVAALLPRATTLTVPFVGHSVLGNDLSDCAARAVRRFFADQPIASTCPRGGFAALFARELFPPTPLPPASLAAVPRARGVPGRAGRTLTAVELTLADFDSQTARVLGQIFSGRFNGFGGLRRGRFGRIGSRAGLERYSYVSGVEISGLFPKPPAKLFRRVMRHFRFADVIRLGKLLFGPVRLRVTGEAAARGSVVWNRLKGSISGRLGGRRVRVKVGFSPVFARSAARSLRAAERCCRFIR